jgi:amino acid transporter
MSPADPLPNTARTAAEKDGTPTLAGAQVPGPMADDTRLLASLGYKQELNRALGLLSSFGVQFSSIAIGSGLFYILAGGLGNFGPASFWAFVIGGALQVFGVGLAVAQLVSAYPLSGGVYQIIARITGKTWMGWQAGWWIVIAHTVSVSTVALGMAPYVSGWFGVTADSPMDLIPWTAGLIVAATVVNIVGVKVAAMVNNVGVVTELIVLFLVIGAFLFFKHPTQPVSFLNDTGGAVANNGWLRAVALALILPGIAISSFDSTGNAAEETHDAARKAPMGVTLANVVSWVAGIAFMGLLLLAIQDLPAIVSDATPAKTIIAQAIGTGFANLVEVLAIASLFACLVMLQLTGARVLWAQARDGQMPGANWLHKLNKERSPITATLLICVVAILILFWSSLLSVLAALTALAWALAYTLVVIVGMVAVFRKRLPKSPWHYGKATPLIFVVATVWSVVLCAALVWSDPLHVGLGMLALIVAGSVLYALIPAKRRGQVTRTDVS